MISVIICSRKPLLLENISTNIKATIGADYELLSADNGQINEGICKVYNRLADQAKFDIVCFVHEDVEFITANWGINVIEHLKYPDTGLIGVAGGDTKSRVPSSWYISARSNRIHLFQHYISKEKKSEYIAVGQEQGKSSHKVSVLDGVFLCTRKDILADFRFDEINFPGFHGYDIDYSLQVSQKYHVLSVSDVLIHHYSEGKPETEWLKSTINVSKKWKRHLPVSVLQLTDSEYRNHHWVAMQIFLDRLVGLNYSLANILRQFLIYSFNEYFTFWRFGSMSKFLLNSISKRKKLGR